MSFLCQVMVRKSWDRILKCSTWRSPCLPKTNPFNARMVPAKCFRLPIFWGFLKKNTVFFEFFLSGVETFFFEFMFSSLAPVSTTNGWLNYKNLGRSFRRAWPGCCNIKQRRRGCGFENRRENHQNPVLDHRELSSSPFITILFDIAITWANKKKTFSETPL